MPGIGNLAAGIRIGFDRMPRNEPRAGDVVRLQQRQETLCADHAELPRESAPGEVIPRAIQIERASKSNVRHAMCRGIYLLMCMANRRSVQAFSSGGARLRYYKSIRFLTRKSAALRRASAAPRSMRAIGGRLRPYVVHHDSGDIAPVRPRTRNLNGSRSGWACGLSTLISRMSACSLQRGGRDRAGPKHPLPPR